MKGVKENGGHGVRVQWVGKPGFLLATKAHTDSFDRTLFYIQVATTIQLTGVWIQADLRYTGSKIIVILPSGRMNGDAFIFIPTLIFLTSILGIHPMIGTPSSPLMIPMGVGSN